MRKFIVLVGILGVLTVASALPAGAATPASFSLSAGGLSISAPTSTVSLGSQTVSNSSSTISGSLGVVSVSDQRGGATTWVASVIATAFTPVPANTTVPAVNVSYAPGTITMSPLVVATAVAALDLTGISPVVNGASTGVSTASWNPTISILIPANYAPGLYSGTITNSVA
ncbi:MAG: hypothetical protein QOE36_3356 [Gaiellaceae bacterium]|jgi:hypothetical protein|nr:hypothetical protein [Gaiellaceae bacterium]